VLKARFHLATRLCICPVCDVSLCSHSVPSGGFNSLADTRAKNKSPFWMGPISGVLSNSNGTIMVLCSDFLISAFASIVYDSNSPLIIVTTLRSFTSLLSERGIQTLIVEFFISGPSTVWKDPVDKVFLSPEPIFMIFFPFVFSIFPSTQDKFPSDLYH